MSLLIWTILGFGSGWLAKQFYNRIFADEPLRLGLFATTALGIIGSVVGGYLGKRLFETGEVGSLTVEGFVTAAIGAFTIVFVWGLLTRPSK